MTKTSATGRAWKPSQIQTIAAARVKLVRAKLRFVLLANVSAVSRPKTGDLYESKEEGLVNLGEARRNIDRHERIAALDEKDMIVFAPEGERKATVTVFTDVDCPYCRKLHSEIEALEQLRHRRALPRVSRARA